MTTPCARARGGFMSKKLKLHHPEGGDPYFFLCISFSLVEIRLHAKTQLSSLPGSALKVCLGEWWWWVVLTVNSVIDNFVF
jgi:hypothetical protein